MSFAEVAYRTRVANATWRWIGWCRSRLLPRRYFALGWKRPVIWSSPREIGYCTLREFPVRRYEGAILDGDWDTLGYGFEDLDVYRAFRARMLHGVEWSQTDFFRRVLGELAEGKEKWSCRTREAFDERCRRLDRLVGEIAREGCRLNRADPTDAITVNIGRHGDLLFNEGRHRLSICKLQDIPSIPVRVTVRHAEWVRFVETVLGHANLRGAGRVPFRLRHPDLAFIPFRYTARRYELIRYHLTTRSGTVVDVGSSWGDLCHAFEPVGFTCHCVERTESDAWFTERLKRASRRRFFVWAGGLSEYARHHGECDVIVSVGGWDPPLGADAARERIREWLEVIARVPAREAFLESPYANDTIGAAAIRQFGAGTLQELVLRRSRFSHAEMIGVTEEGTSIYRFS